RCPAFDNETTGAKRSNSSRQRRHGQVRRCVTGKFGPASALSSGLRRSRRHEPGRFDAALRRGWTGTSVPGGGGRDCEWKTATETRSAQIRCWIAIDGRYHKRARAHERDERNLFGAFGEPRRLSASI